MGTISKALLKSQSHQSNKMLTTETYTGTRRAWPSNLSSLATCCQRGCSGELQGRATRSVTPRMSRGANTCLTLPDGVTRHAVLCSERDTATPVLSISGL